MDEDQETWDYLNAQETVNLVSDDPFIEYGQWVLDFEYEPGTFTVSDVYFSMTTTEKNADLTIKHDYDGSVLTVWEAIITQRAAAALFSENIPKYSQALNTVEPPKELENDYQTVSGWQASTTDEVIDDDSIVKTMLREK